MERHPNTKINMESQRALNGENNFEKEEQRWNFLTLPDFHKILQIYSNQNSMASA